MQILYRYFFIFLLGSQALSIRSARADFEESVEEGCSKTISVQESGQLTSLEVGENQWVDKDQVLGYFEQMKMKKPIIAPYSGYVSKILISPPLETRPYPMRSLEPILVLKRATRVEPTTPTPPTTRERLEEALSFVQGSIPEGQNQRFVDSRLLLDAGTLENAVEPANENKTLPQPLRVSLASGFFFLPNTLHLSPSMLQPHNSLGSDVSYEGVFSISEAEGHFSSLSVKDNNKTVAEMTLRAKDQAKSKDLPVFQENNTQKMTHAPIQIFDESDVSGGDTRGILSKAWAYTTLEIVDPLLKGLFFQIQLPLVHGVMWSWVLLFAVLLAQEEFLVLKLSRRFSRNFRAKRGEVYHHMDVILQSNSNCRITREIIRHA